MLKISDTMADLYPPDMVTDLFGKDLADVSISERTTVFQELWHSWSDNSFILPEDKVHTAGAILSPNMKSLYEWQQKRVMVEIPWDAPPVMGVSVTSHWKDGKQIYMSTRSEIRFATPELLAIAKILLS